jgi:hypothetical protein
MTSMIPMAPKKYNRNQQNTMKKFLVIIAIMASMTATAQVKLGVKGGLNVTSMSMSSSVFDASNRTGFFIGPTLRFTLPIIGLGVDASALYDQRDAKIKATSTSTTEETVSQKQIAIPINLRYSLGLGETAGLFFFAGPQFGFNVGDKNQTIGNQVGEWTLKSSNISVNVGAGVMLLTHLQLSANYNIACGKTGDFKVSDVNKGNSRNNAWQIAAAYYF